MRVSDETGRVYERAGRASKGARSWTATEAVGRASEAIVPGGQPSSSELDFPLQREPLFMEETPGHSQIFTHMYYV